MTVFDFSDKAQKLLADSYGNIYSYSLAAILCVLLVAFIAIILLRKENHTDRKYILGAVVFLAIFGSHFLKGYLHNDYIEGYTELKTIYDNRQYEIVEGVVHVIHLEPEGGHDSGDIIEINKVEFELSCYHDTLGYNKTIVYGGVLTEGTFARVFYYQSADPSARGRIILRIDLLEEPTVPFKKIDPLLPCAG
ncbi:hypothetical protein ANAEL_01321 [Anaerolineales bacterium]|nr:hypothetical protein ANAEL_01321 [Anaerolineales bacterium]